MKSLEREFLEMVRYGLSKDSRKFGRYIYAVKGVEACGGLQAPYTPQCSSEKPQDNIGKKI